MKKEDKELIELFASIKQHQKNIERQKKIFSAIEEKAKQSKRKKSIVFWSSISSIAACFCIVWFTNLCNILCFYRFSQAGSSAFRREKSTSCFQFARLHRGGARRFPLQSTQALKALV